MKSLHHPLSALSLAVGLWLCLSAPSLHAQASLSLNGGEVQVPANTSLTPTNLTLEAWVNFPASGNLTIASRGNGSDGATTDYILQIGSNGQPGTNVDFFGAGAWDTSTSGVPFNVWTHVAVTYNGTNKLFYINGVPGGAVARSGPLYTGDSATSPFYIGLQGQYCQCNPFEGEISEVRLWNYVRSPSQIRADMVYSSGSQSGLVAYYHLNEGSGTTANDASGNAHTGTLENGASWSASGPPVVLVTNTADSGPGTLRSAIANAVHGQIIGFAANLSGLTIYLASTLKISTNLTIEAAALPGGISLSGSNTVEILEVASNATVVLDSLTIKNGRIDAYLGGGLNNDGTVTLNNCLLENNVGLLGGGMFNYGTATLNECTLSDNDTAYVYGGDIGNVGTLTLNGCYMDNQSGAGSGGVFNENSGTVTLNDCTLYDFGPGYVLYNLEGTATLTDCTLYNNTQGIYNQGTLTVNDCTLWKNGFYDGPGGAIDNLSIATLNNCTLFQNSAGLGGAIYNAGIATLNECTLSGNMATNGGAIYNVLSLAITNCIVAGNLDFLQKPTFDISDNSGAITLGGSNLVQEITNFDGMISGPAPLTNAPNLAPLNFYGGPTKTMPPFPGSPAIGAGSVAVNTFATDQRGFARTQNGLIDLGAVEMPAVQPFSASPPNGLPPLTVHFDSTNADRDGSAIVGWNWSFGDGNASTNQNPTNVYSKGIFSPGLIVTNNLGLALAVFGPAISAVFPTLTSDGISQPGANLTLSGEYGISGLVYTVLASTNVASPLSQWTRLSTDSWSTNGAFTLTLTNALNPLVPQRFYLLQMP
jgi:hypothetical protein